MSRRPARCTEAELARAVRVAEKHGAGWGVEVLLDGTIRLYRPDQTKETAQKPCSLDDRPPWVF